MDWAKTTARPDEQHLSFGIWCLILEILRFINICSHMYGPGVVVEWRRVDLGFPALLPWICSHMHIWLAEHPCRICHVSEGRSGLWCTVSELMPKIGCWTHSLKSELSSWSLVSVCPPGPTLCMCESTLIFLQWWAKMCMFWWCWMGVKVLHWSSSAAWEAV